MFACTALHDLELLPSGFQNICYYYNIPMCVHVHYFHASAHLSKTCNLQFCTKLIINCAATQ